MNLRFTPSISQKKIILLRQKHICLYCKKRLKKNIHFHHRIPVKDGGLTIVENLVALHNHCHKELEMRKRAEKKDNQYENPYLPISIQELLGIV